MTYLIGLIIVMLVCYGLIVLEGKVNDAGERSEW